MKVRRRDRQLWPAIGAMLMLVMVSASAFAQCSMCRASLSGSSGAAMAKSLNLGIIVLLIPPVAIFCAIFITAIKYRKTEGEASRHLP